MKQIRCGGGYINKPACSSSRLDWPSEIPTTGEGISGNFLLVPPVQDGVRVRRTVSSNWRLVVRCLLSRSRLSHFRTWFEIQFLILGPIIANEFSWRLETSVRHLAIFLQGWNSGNCPMAIIVDKGYLEIVRSETMSDFPHADCYVAFPSPL